MPQLTESTSYFILMSNLPCKAMAHSHKYYDGQDWLDVVKYQQEVFLPAMAKYWERLVEYKIGEVHIEDQKTITSGCAHVDSGCP